MPLQERIKSISDFKYM